MDNSIEEALIHRPNEMKETFIVSGKIVTINLFFSMNCLEKYFEYFKQSGDYKQTFAKVVFYMYDKIEKSESEAMLSESDFVVASDSELSEIVNYILNNDESAKREFDKIDTSDIFEKFYIAYDNLLKEATKPVSQSLEQLGKIAKAIETPQLTAFKGIIAQQSTLMPFIQISQMGSGLASLTSAFQSQSVDITRALSAIRFDGLAQQLLSRIDLDYTRNLPKFDFPEIKSLIRNIPRIDFDISRIVSPFGQQFADMQHLAESLRFPFSAFEQLFAEIDFSMLTYQHEWSERHDALVKFGWFYLDELPDEIIDDIYARQESISYNEVDSLIKGYFRQDSCSALKKIVNSWNQLPYFMSRKRVFHEALINHSRKYYNSSTTLLALHTEGVITDFVRLNLQTPRFKVEKAISDITNQMDELPMESLTLSDWKIYSVVLENIQVAFNEKFELSNPDSASNNSRHKIAHGHAVEPETEANSLKRFLYLNAIYRLFSLLDSKLKDE